MQIALDASNEMLVLSFGLNGYETRGQVQVASLTEGRWKCARSANTLRSRQPYCEPRCARATSDFTTPCGGLNSSDCKL
jgi:hypothetical protein